MYIEAVLKGYKLIKVPVNEDLRIELETKTMDKLATQLSLMKNLHNISDISTKERLIRAIEIEKYYAANPDINLDYPKIKHIIFGLIYERDQIRKRITERLKSRLNNGMIDEVKYLLENGIASNDLIYYGLEYKHLTLYVIGEISYDEMFTKLNTAIHQFAKRQMTWFRKMERNGMKINWIDGCLPINKKIEKAMSFL